MISSERRKTEQSYHESDDELRSRSRLIRGLYRTPLFSEAESYQFDALGELHRARVLDYGCGGGWTTAELQRRGAQVTGFDISASRLAEARGHLWRDPHGDRGGESARAAALVQCAGEGLPFADSTFDHVFGKQVLHHVDLATALPEIARVLRQEGRAVFLEPLVHNPVLQAYRRLTPKLRSPTERALSMADLERIAAFFRRCSHREFCLLTVLPALGEAVTATPRTRHSGSTKWSRVYKSLQRLDRRLLDTWPWLARFAWETVIILER